MATSFDTVFSLPLLDKGARVSERFTKILQERCGLNLENQEKFSDSTEEGKTGLEEALHKINLDKLAVQSFDPNSGKIELTGISKDEAETIKKVFSFVAVFKKLRQIEETFRNLCKICGNSCGNAILSFREILEKFEARIPNQLQALKEYLRIWQEA